MACVLLCRALMMTLKLCRYLKRNALVFLFLNLSAIAFAAQAGDGAAGFSCPLLLGNLDGRSLTALQNAAVKDAGFETLKSRVESRLKNIQKQWTQKPWLDLWEIPAVWKQARRPADGFAGVMSEIKSQGLPDPDLKAVYGFLDGLSDENLGTALVLLNMTKLPPGQEPEPHQLTFKEALGMMAKGHVDPKEISDSVDFATRVMSRVDRSPGVIQKFLFPYSIRLLFMGFVQLTEEKVPFELVGGSMGLAIRFLPDAKGRSWISRTLAAFQAREKLIVGNRPGTPPNSDYKSEIQFSYDPGLLLWRGIDGSENWFTVEFGFEEVLHALDQPTLLASHFLGNLRTESHADSGPLDLWNGAFQDWGDQLSTLPGFRNAAGDHPFLSNYGKYISGGDVNQFLGGVKMAFQRWRRAWVNGDNEGQAQWRQKFETEFTKTEALTQAFRELVRDAGNRRYNVIVGAEPGPFAKAQIIFPNEKGTASYILWLPTRIPTSFIRENETRADQVEATQVREGMKQEAKTLFSRYLQFMNQQLDATARDLEFYKSMMVIMSRLPRQSADAFWKQLSQAPATPNPPNR